MVGTAISHQNACPGVMAMHAMALLRYMKPADIVALLRLPLPIARTHVVAANAVALCMVVIDSGYVVPLIHGK